MYESNFSEDEKALTPWGARKVNRRVTMIEQFVLKTIHKLLDLKAFLLKQAKI